jgi:hypothetical protein
MDDGTAAMKAFRKAASSAAESGAGMADLTVVGSDAGMVATMAYGKAGESVVVSGTAWAGPWAFSWVGSLAVADEERGGEPRGVEWGAIRNGQ